ncbi:MAG TPA: EAL domain-containing protein [Pseudonocardiaceae bacterium]|nr:EAL domain-containing protein [Pseudonocardiaceae bacterium]
MADEHPRLAVPETGTDSLTAFVREWAIAAISTSHTPVSRGEVELVLREIAAHLVKLLHAEPFDPQTAAEDGRRLVTENFATSAALNHTLRLLGNGLLPAAGLPQTAPWLDRLAQVTGSFSAGYVEAVRDRLFDEQEMIKTAVFRARDAAERARLASEARFHAVFQSTAVGIAIADLSGHIELTNPSLGVILGRPDADLVDRPLAELCTDEDAPKVADGFATAVHGPDSQYVGDVSFIGGDGEPVWTRLSISLVKTEYGAPSHAVTMVEDISDLHLLRQDQLVHALRDQLTGLPNRTQFMSTLGDALRKAQPGEHIALCYVDLDGFKVINDGVGHEFGDELLRRVAHTLLTAFPEPNATVARIGGDGFAVLLTASRGGSEFSERVSDMLQLLTEPIFVDNETGVGVSASAGIVERPAFGLTAGELVQAAELTTHRAKVNGKAQWELYDPELDERDRRRFRLAAAIPGALETNEFAITFQPIADLDDRTLAGFHTSVRWHHPKLGLLRPKDFFDLAEETGFIVPLGRWVLEETGRLMARWYAEHGEAMPIVTLSMTDRLAREQDLIKMLREIIDDTGLPVSKLRLSIPSDVVVDRFGETLDNLGFFDGIDVKVIVSGYGNGNVGLVNLRELPIHGVSTSAKATRAVIGSGPDSPFAQGLGHLVSLTKQLDVPLIANGVADAAAARLLTDLGVRVGAGPYLGEPVEPDAASRLIATGRC